MVSWNKIIQPMNCGGMGTRSMQLQNTTLLWKLFCCMFQYEDKFWVSLLSYIYLKKDDLFMEKALTGSPTQKAIIKALNLL